MEKKVITEEINKTTKVLKAGGTILYPTDTIWGIGCDATNNKAVKKIYKLKKRTKDKNLIVLLDKQQRLTSYLKEIHLIAIDLINSFDKPLTIIFPNAKNLAKELIADDKSIAIRITKDEFCKELINSFGKPIVSTSANISGEPEPIVFSQISQEIINNVDYVVNLKELQIKQFRHSTIVKIEKDREISIIRD